MCDHFLLPSVRSSASIYQLILSHTHTQVLPSNLAHGKRDRRDALFDLRLDYFTEPAPDLPSSTCNGVVAEAAAAGEGSEAAAGEDAETAGSEAAGSSARCETGAVLGVARVFPTSDALLQVCGVGMCACV